MYPAEASFLFLSLSVVEYAKEHIQVQKTSRLETKGLSQKTLNI